MSDSGSILEARKSPAQFLRDWPGPASLVGGAVLVAAGVVWAFAARPMAWTIIFNENIQQVWEDKNGPMGPSAVEEASRSVADRGAATHLSVILPLAVLVGLGLALIAATLATSRWAKVHTNLATTYGRAGIAAAVFGLVLTIAAASVPDPNGTTLLGGSYDAKTWLPVFLVGLALFVGGVVVILVERSRVTGPAVRARRAADGDQLAADMAEADIHRRAEEIKRWEGAYALAHNGEMPPPGFVPPAAFGTPTSTSSTNGLAIAALIVSIAMNGVIGLILGYVARRQINERHQGGRRLAIAAIVIGWVQIGLGVATAVAYVVFWLQAT